MTDKPERINGHVLEWRDWVLQAQCARCLSWISRELIAEARVSPCPGPPENARAGTIELTSAEVQLIADLRRTGKMWRKKDGTAIPTSWSATLIAYAGGVERLAAEWEPET